MAIEDGNPVTAIRERLGGSKAGFAALLGVPYRAVTEAESGYLLQPRRVLTAIEAAGLGDAEELAAQYERWRAARCAALLAGLETRHAVAR